MMLDKKKESFRKRAEKFLKEIRESLSNEVLFLGKDAEDVSGAKCQWQ